MYPWQKPLDESALLMNFRFLLGNLIKRLDSKHEWFETTNTQINATTFLDSDEQMMTNEPAGSFKQLSID